MRTQPPVLSPLRPAALAQGAMAALGAGDDVAGLCAILEERYAAERVVLVGSGTQALTLAITIGAASKDGHVALPAFGCYDLATAAVGAGVRVKLYDVNADTLAPDPASLEQSARESAAVIVAPFYGAMFRMEHALQIARSAGAILIEDAAQGHGATCDGRPAGSFGDASIISFGRGKGWTGSGGGALMLRNGTPSPPAPRRGARGASSLLTGVAQCLLGRPPLYALPSRIPALGLGSTPWHDPKPVEGMSRASAAIALATMGMADEESRYRKRNAAEYESLLSPAFRTPRIDDGCAAGWLRLPVRIPGRAVTARAAAAHRPHGVSATYPQTLRQLPQLQRALKGQNADFPGAKTIVEEYFTLPTHSALSTRERAWLAKSLNEMFE